jgi:metal-responsive CopG/Arc/MetJ family transcriptional regulator
MHIIRVEGTNMEGAQKRGWKTVQLPKDLLNIVDEIVKQAELGYTSRNEFVKEAVRLRIEEIQRNLHERAKAVKQE